MMVGGGKERRPRKGESDGPTGPSFQVMEWLFGHAAA